MGVRPEGFHRDWIDIVERPLPRLIPETIAERFGR